MLCLMYTRVQLALLAARAHCWFMFNLLSTRTPGSLSVGLISGLSSPILNLQPGLPCFRCRIQHLLLLNFKLLVVAQLSDLSWSLCKASPPLMELTAPPDLVSSANLLKTPSSPTLKSFRKTLRMFSHSTITLKEVVARWGSVSSPKHQVMSRDKRKWP